jgi:hypothetical protein
MGWLGWSYETTRDTPIWAVELAYDGKRDMLKAIYGDGSNPDGDKPSENMIPATDDNLKSMFDGMGVKRFATLADARAAGF